MTIREYVNKITKRYSSGITSEKPYRGDLKIFIESLIPDAIIAIGPAKVECGTPDYIVRKSNFSLGYIIILNIDQPLDSLGTLEEFDLCKKSLTNLLFTNYLEFHFYRDGVLKSFISIAEIKNGMIESKPGSHLSAEALIEEFYSYRELTIRSAFNLSRTMANKAQLLACVIENAITQDEQESNNQNYKTSKISLKEQLADVNKVFNNNISARDLANIYAQTISFGMFAAWLYGGPVMEDFSRQNAAELIPLSYTNLRKLFQYLASHDLDDRIIWVIDELANVFRVIDRVALSENFKKTDSKIDPFKLFHETFMDEYDPKFRERRNEFDKPEPMVTFIEEAVIDCISKKKS